MDHQANGGNQEMGPESDVKRQPKPEPVQDIKKATRNGAFTIPVQML